MRMAFDMSSVLWTGLRSGKDQADGIYVDHNSKEKLVNSAAFGYENAVGFMVSIMEDWKLSPKDCILVFEGRDSKKRRCMVEPMYKNRPGSEKHPEEYVQFNLLKDKIREEFCNLGAIAVTQDFVEGDDVLAWLANNTEDDMIIVTNDNDLVVLNRQNEYGAKVMVAVSNQIGVNKYGEFDFALVTLYKSLVGDSSDNIKGCPGFGPAAFLKLIGTYGEDGAYELMELVSRGARDELAVLAEGNQCKILGKIVEQWEAVVKSYRLALLHPEWVNTMRQPLVWMPGMVKSSCEDERLRKWRAQHRLVTADNYDKFMEFMKSKVNETPFFTIDFETTTPPDSDDWLEQRGKGGVDVIGSTIVSMGITFGANLQYGFYLSTNHADTNNITAEQLALAIEAIPQSKHIIAHNAAGFELPVAYNAFCERWKNNGWRGMIPNMIDTRIAATFWDENQQSHGLKQLSKLLLGYTQGTYEETTSKTAKVGELSGGVITKSFTVTIEDGSTDEMETRQYKMDQLTAKEVTAYGLDDVFTAGALWNFFQLFMQLDHTYQAFLKLEQKPAYLSALAYVRGLDVDVPRLKLLEHKDKELSDKCWSTIETFLIEKGWDGVTCPVYDELTPANIKQAALIVTGVELKTMVRTQSKLAVLVSQIEHDSAETLGRLIEENRVDLVNEMVARYYKGKPDFNVGSPKQLAKLLYEVIGIPIRLRNKATDTMRAAGIKEGNPRTDDSAVDMAIKFGDVTGREAEVLESLLKMKSCNTRNALYWSAYGKMIHWKTGRIHPEVRQSSTNTRRWTSGQPNIQQMEADPEGVRSVIKDGNRLIVSLDQSSQEVRLMTELSQDEGLLSCYVGDNLRDTHSLVAHRIAKVSYEEFMAMRESEDKAVADRAAGTRKLAKSVFFGFLFGAMAPKLAETLGISEDEAQAYIDAINAAFPGIRAYQDKSANMAETLGYVPIIGGTKRHLAAAVTSEDKWESSKALRQAGNARIQGAAANQIKTVMSSIWDSDLLDKTSMKWLFCVHDEIVISTDRHDAVEVVKDVHGFMTKAFLTLLPSESSIGIGKNFGQLLEQPEKEFSGGKFNENMLKQAVDLLSV